MGPMDGFCDALLPAPFRQLRNAWVKLIVQCEIIGNFLVDSINILTDGIYEYNLCTI